MAGTVAGTGRALGGHWAGTVRAPWVGRGVYACEPRSACEKIGGHCDGYMFFSSVKLWFACEKIGGHCDGYVCFLSVKLRFMCEK